MQLPKDIKGNLDVASLGLEMGGCILVGYLIGTWLDGRFGWEPWGLVIGLAIGFGAATKGVIRVVRRARRVMMQPSEVRPARSLEAPGAHS